MNKDELRDAAQYGRFPHGEVLVVEAEFGSVIRPIVCAFFADIEGDVVMAEYTNENLIELGTAFCNYLTFQPEIILNIYSLSKKGFACAEKLLECLTCRALSIKPVGGKQAAELSWRE